MTVRGLWLPLITPFRDGAIDFESYDRLIDHYLAFGVDGLFPLGTTGEAPTLDDGEFDAVVERTVTRAGKVPVFVGVGGNDTRKVTKTLKRLERHRFEGIVSVCPYYNRPSQDGLIAHFRAIASVTDRPVLIYNIPYRTAVNLSNDSMLELAQIPNIIGLKDATANLERGEIGDQGGCVVHVAEHGFTRALHPGGEAGGVRIRPFVHAVAVDFHHLGLDMPRDQFARRREREHLLCNRVHVLGDGH